jgi:Fumarylacetoacetate (FAA) hydrolase family
MQLVLQPRLFLYMPNKGSLHAGRSKSPKTRVRLFFPPLIPYPNVLVLPSFPVLFFKPVTALIGPSANVIIPRVAQPTKDHFPDYEVEFVIVLGKAAKNVSEADALDYVLGYTGANDVCNPNHPLEYDI